MALSQLLTSPSPSPLLRRATASRLGFRPLFSSFNPNNKSGLNHLECEGSACLTKYGGSSYCELFAFSVTTTRKNAMARGAVGRSSIPGEQDDHAEDGDEVTNEALRATIKKSKKVLEMQKNLLQQIVERRKVVSSIREHVAGVETETVAYSQSSSSFGDVNTGTSSSELPKINGIVIPTDSASRSVEDLPISFEDIKTGTSIGELHKINGIIIPSESSTQLLEEVTENSQLTLSKDLLDGKEKFGVSSLAGSSEVDVLEKVREAEINPAQHQFMPFKLHDIAELFAHKSAEQETTAEEEMPPVQENVDPPPLAGPNVMNIIVVAAECAPWSKTGGLGDVVGALPKALARRGHRVMVVVPKYGGYAEPQEIGVIKRYNVDGQDVEVKYFHAYIDGVDFVFIDSPLFRHIGNDVYSGGREDILKRMVLFCKAAVEVPWYVPCGGFCYGDGNLVFIANDWHTSLLPVYLKAYYRENGLMVYTRCVMVIHNIAHQGRGPVTDFRYTSLPEHYLERFRFDDPVGGEHMNIFAAGIKACDRLVTVSRGYAWELKTQEGGWGLHNVIKENDWKIQGIVNGVDTKDWNPKIDVHLQSDGYTNYSLETLKTGKPQCKAALQRELGLPVRDNVPVIGFIGRLDYQKGIDIIAEAMPWIVGQDVQLAMLGTGRHDLENMLRKHEGEHPDKVRGWVGFSVKMAHRITAGADILLMPSRFEPCGLNQLHAMVYGTVPVVHAVGGLRDTVHPFNPSDDTGLGWTFDRAEPNRMIDALSNCLSTYRNHASSWEGIQRRGMMQDLSWDTVALLYEKVLVTAKYQW